MKLRKRNKQIVIITNFLKGRAIIKVINLKSPLQQLELLENKWNKAQPYISIIYLRINDYDHHKNNSFSLKSSLQWSGKADLWFYGKRSSSERMVHTVKPHYIKPNIWPPNIMKIFKNSSHWDLKLWWNSGWDFKLTLVYTWHLRYQHSIH